VAAAAPRRYSEREFKSLPTTFDNTRDVAAINRRYAAVKDNPFRKKQGVFSVPIGATRQQREPYIKRATEAFVKAMQQQGWTLRGKPTVTGPFARRDIETGAVLLDMHEFRIEGTFATVPKPQRIEVGGIIEHRDARER
jgi:hypothetical protein